MALASSGDASPPKTARGRGGSPAWRPRDPPPKTSRAGEAQHRQGVGRQCSPESRRQTLALQLAGRDRNVAHDPLTVDGKIGCADVMTELVLAGVLGEEAIEVGVIRAKGLAVGQTPGVA